VAIYILVISPMLQGCTARKPPTSDHCAGSRFHNRDSVSDYSLSQEVKTNPGVLIESLPTIHLILISHNHYDHLDLRSLHALFDRQRTAPPTILVGRGVGPLLKNAGLSSYAELDWDESVTVKDAQVHFLVEATNFVAPHYGQVFRY
jgi:L-ascorbate metabolism protein UlaG (beta-lactamase superfamily)